MGFVYHPEPLGSLAPSDSSSPWSAELLDLSKAIPRSERRAIANYLDACPIFLAWMEHTRDEIGGRFGVDGGSAIASDGQYYWRVDAASYVLEYGVSLPRTAISHLERVEWIAPRFERDEYLRIYKYLDERLGGGTPVA